MAITTFDQYKNSYKQDLAFTKTSSRTSTALGWMSLFDIAGQPAAGTLAAGNTANGIVPTSAVAGYPSITPFLTGQKGYFAKIEYSNTVACRVALFDRVFVAGAYAYNANTTLASQPTYANRLLNNNYNSLEIWVEQVTAGSGTHTTTVGYTNQDGTTGRSTGTFTGPASPILGRCWQLPLQAGDTGVQAINTVAGSSSGAVGTFNVMVLRPIWTQRINVGSVPALHGLLETGLLELFDSSALYIQVCPDSTASGIPDFQITLASG